MGQCVKRHVKGGDPPSPFLSSMTQRIWQFYGGKSFDKRMLEILQKKYNSTIVSDSIFY